MEISLTKERSSSGQVSLENTRLNIVNGFFRQFDKVNEVYVSWNRMRHIFHLTTATSSSCYSTLFVFLEAHVNTDTLINNSDG